MTLQTSTCTQTFATFSIPVSGDQLFDQTMRNKCFRARSVSLCSMAKITNENISALISITKKDRDSVIRALNQVQECANNSLFISCQAINHANLKLKNCQVGGDLGLAVEVLCGSSRTSPGFSEYRPVEALLNLQFVSI